MLQEAIRRHVLRVLRAWRERFLLSDDMTRGLTTAFLRARDLPSQEVRSKAGSCSRSRRFDQVPVTL